MGGDDEFLKTDMIATEIFARAAENQKVRRIIYLGGLASPSEDLSKHLSSRLETGQALRDMLNYLIVISTHGLTGLDHFLLGSITEKVVRRSHCPVFTVRTFGKSLL